MVLVCGTVEMIQEACGDNALQY